VTSPTPHSSESRARRVTTAIVAVALVVVLLVVAGVVRRPAPAPTVPPASSAPTATPTPTPGAAPPIEIWATSLDREFSTTYGSWHSAEARDVAAPGVDATIDIDRASVRQTFNGVGAALTHSSASVLSAMPAEQRAELLGELFAPDGPVRLGVLRIPFGGSDFVAEPAYTYNDIPEGETDWNLQRFSTRADDNRLRPILREILAIAPDLQLIASPWSAPAWLKDSGSLVGGRLLDDDRAAPTYARYLVRAVEEYTAAGIPIDAITVQNEPQARTPDGYPGTDMPVADAEAVIAALGPALQEAGLETRIFGYDHNWALHPGDLSSTPEGADPEYEYPADLLRSAAAPWVDGIAYHCYSGDAGRMTRLHNDFPNTELWVTECSGSHGADDSAAQIFRNTLSWQTQNLMIGSLNNWATTVLTWNLALDSEGGPHIGGCDTCTGVVTVGPDGSVERNAEYYALAGVGRFAEPGATVSGTSRGPDGDAPDDLTHVALHNPDGSTVVLVFNGADQQRVVDCVLSVSATDGATDRVARATVPAHSVATIVIPKHPAD
jgi:glucosylceramidase